jgi:glycosyltransferase involved in cell wall biosynthesis
VKVIWLCNSKPAALDRKHGVDNKSLSSWIDTIYDDLSVAVDITVVYPCFDNIPFNSIKIKGGIGVKQERLFPFFPLNRLVDRYIEILKEIKPDVIHIWGCETPRCYAFIRAAEIVGIRNRVVVYLQGSAQQIGRNYYGGVPFKDVLYMGLRAFSRLELGFFSGLRYRLYGYYENRVYKMPVLFIGRTSWDYTLLLSKSFKANYHTVYEEIRQEFYVRRWRSQGSIKGRIFISQASYPLKGFDNVLEALSILNEWVDYPIEIYVAGDFDENRSVYIRYLTQKIQQKGLKSQIHFIGMLSAEDVAKQLEISNIYLNPSYIENESNALSEAMLVGTPVIISFVGGMVDRIKHDWSGLSFPVNSPLQLAWCIKKTIDNEKEAEIMAARAHINIKEILSRGESAKKINAIYTKLAGRS